MHPVNEHLWYQQINFSRERKNARQVNTNAVKVKTETTTNHEVKMMLSAIPNIRRQLRIAHQPTSRHIQKKRLFHQ